jgi:hypothetical protein
MRAVRDPRDFDSLRPILAPWAWALGLTLVRLVPGARDLLPCLRALDGWLGYAGPLVVASWVSAVRAGWLRWPAVLDRAVPRLTIAALVLIAAGLWYSSRLRVTGDEPHYLLMAQSLWREGDLDLRDNFERRDYLEYTPGPVAPHYGNPRRDGRPFPAHSPALPFVLAPVYAIGGRLLCVVVLALCGACLAHEVALLARRAGADALGERVAWAACVGPPAFFYGFHVYTELPSALLIAVALHLVGDSAGGPRRAAAGALAIAALLWLHLKLAPAAAVLAAVGLWRMRGRARMVLLAVLSVAGALFLAWFQYVFGRPSPFAIYGGMPPEFSEGSPLRAAVGLLIDRSFGLLPFAPVFLVALAGLARLARLAEGRAHLALFLALLGPVVTWRMWWGGQCPPARFLVPAIGMLATALALQVTQSRRRGLARWTGVLTAAGSALALVAIASPGALLLVSRGDRPTRLWAALSGSDRPIERYLPSLVFGPPEELRVAAIWVGVIGVLLALDALARHRDWADRAFRTGALPIALGLTIGVLVDAWARPARTETAPAGVTVTPD